MKRVVVPCFLLSACSADTLPYTPAEPVRMTEDAPLPLSACGAESLGQMVGTPLAESESLLPANARVIAPDSMVTQDYRPDRVNVYVDGDGVIQRVTCG